MFRKEAHIHKLMKTVSAIRSVENLHSLMTWMVPRLQYDTRVVVNKSEHDIDDQVTISYIQGVQTLHYLLVYLLDILGHP